MGCLKTDTAVVFCLDKSPTGQKTKKAHGDCWHVISPHLSTIIKNLKQRLEVKLLNQFFWYLQCFCSRTYDLKIFKFQDKKNMKIFSLKLSGKAKMETSYLKIKNVQLGIIEQSKNYVLYLIHLNFLQPLLISFLLN